MKKFILGTALAFPKPHGDFPVQPTPGKDSGA